MFEQMGTEGEPLLQGITGELGSCLEGLLSQVRVTMQGAGVGLESRGQNKVLMVNG